MDLEREGPTRTEQGVQCGQGRRQGVGVGAIVAVGLDQQTDRRNPAQAAANDRERHADRASPKNRRCSTHTRSLPVDA